MRRQQEHGVAMLEYIIALSILAITFYIVSNFMQDEATQHAEFGQSSGADMIHCGTRPDGDVQAYGSGPNESCL